MLDAHLHLSCHETISSPEWSPWAQLRVGKSHQHLDGRSRPAFPYIKIPGDVVS
jgi:hypothetical protein